MDAGGRRSRRCCPSELNEKPPPNCFRYRGSKSISVQALRQREADVRPSRSLTMAPPQAFARFDGSPGAERTDHKPVYWLDVRRRNEDAGEGTLIL